MPSECTQLPVSLALRYWPAGVVQFWMVPNGDIKDVTYPDPVFIRAQRCVQLRIRLSNHLCRTHRVQQLRCHRVNVNHLIDIEVSIFLFYDFFFRWSINGFQETRCIH
ncbi:Uncharacterised protein [Klebsiella pneumoniae subsp. ozaenae]|uniref:Uncharacterized protein n=1 Tax=Klebsiella pneumoniae subsp. ozaenae TaxID=574 RepID=A0A377ZDG6_KLEPO|nr:Uncharacterised protein [Klebsiella pneumoniae subsp. ozaenae]